VDSLGSAAADHLTFELVADKGPAPEDLDPLFAALDRDDDVDGVRDQANLPSDSEPERVTADLASITAN
jgi:hypothetical protein